MEACPAWGTPLEGVARAQSPTGDGQARSHLRRWKQLDASPARSSVARAGRPPGDGRTVKTRQALSDEQERLRIEGLRALARIIARRALASSGLPADLMPNQRGDRTPRERVRRDRSA